MLSTDLEFPTGLIGGVYFTGRNPVYAADCNTSKSIKKDVSWIDVAATGLAGI